jgi:hypothetical protein
MEAAEILDFSRALKRAARAPWPQQGAAHRSVLKAFSVEGLATPIGDGDKKTASPGTYRPVGPSCPSSCPFLPASEAGAQSIDWAYVEALETLGEACGLPQDGAHVAWTYTHEADRKTVSMLRAALPWLSIRHSDARHWLGAVVAERDEVPALRARGLRPLVCPAQRTQIDCTKCRACWEKPERLIVFLPHGAGQKKLRQRRAGAAEKTTKIAPCYAANGNTGVHSRRATVDPWASARAAMAAISWARATGRLARLHVSGDFHRVTP